MNLLPVHLCGPDKDEEKFSTQIGVNAYFMTHLRYLLPGLL